MNDTQETHSPPARRSRFQSSLKTVLLLLPISAMVILIHRERAKSAKMLELSRVTIEVYTDRLSFEKRLGGGVRCIDFENVDTTKSDVVGFNPRRFAAEGVVLNSPGGLFVGRTFGFPKQYPPVSGKNSYAPGPVGKNPGGNTTDVTFEVDGDPGLVAGTILDAL